MINQKKGMSVTLALIMTSFILFILVLVLAAFGVNLIYYIGIMPASILSGQNLWTIITNIFMHASLSHLFMNMMSLLFLGSFLERILGRKKFFIFYITAGIFAGLFFVFISAIFNIELNTIAVGASGAIFGIAGLLAVVTPKLPVYILFIPIPVPMWLASILILVIMWLFSVFAGLPIGNTAHLGGLIFGVAYGSYLRIRHKRRIYLLNRFLMH